MEFRCGGAGRGCVFLGADRNILLTVTRTVLQPGRDRGVNGERGCGVALGGKIPFVNTFAALLTLRACEQIRTCVAYADANVKLIGGYSGVSDYKDGPTHFAVNDIALMRSMPNMTVIAPADNIEAANMVAAIAEHPGPVYARTAAPEARTSSTNRMVSDRQRDDSARRRCDHHRDG
jgi:deoxyxylulose-5-phosphate synthase